VTENTKATGLKIVPGSIEQAPLIYFDGVASYGVYNGAVQIELVANVIVPDGDVTRIDVLMTTHLRCTPAAAIALRNAIDGALEMRSLPAAEVSQSAKPN
jgi:hypothetical protein